MDPEQADSYLYFLDLYFQDFQLQNIILGVLIVLLIICSALVSGSEVAFFSLNPKRHNDINSELHKLLSKPKELLATILIVNNIINVAIVILTEVFLESIIIFKNLPIFVVPEKWEWFGGLTFGLEWPIKIILVTSILLIFGEILPKVYANKNAHQFSKMMTKPMYFLNRVFGFLSRFLTATSDVIDKSGNHKMDIALTDLSKALTLTKQGEDIEEHKLLEGIVKFGNTEVSQIMTSRVDLFAIPITASFNELIELIQTSGFSRIPVFQDNMDNIKGVIYIKDLIRYLRYDDNFRWQALIHDVFYVPENKKIDDLLKNFQEKKMHMAVVVDEYGGTSGLATLEDVLEEIVGDINNEMDHSDDQYNKIDESTYIFEGKTPLIDFCRVVNVSDSNFDSFKGEAETLAGLFLEMFGKFPENGEQITIEGFTFVVVSQEKSRIDRIKVILDEK